MDDAQAKKRAVSKKKLAEIIENASAQIERAMARKASVTWETGIYNPPPFFVHRVRSVRWAREFNKALRVSIERYEELKKRADE